MINKPLTLRFLLTS